MDPDDFPVVVSHAFGSERQLLARRPLRAGEHILSIEGRIVRRPSRHSVQVDDDLHVVPRDGENRASVWMFLHHSCTPNAVVRGRELIAWRPIAAGEAVAFDYNSTEDRLAAPFSCLCGTCGGRWIRGFAELDADEREALRPLLAEHLRRRLDSADDDHRSGVRASARSCGAPRQ